MAAVVFMRGVNVGGHQAFRPSVLAARLAELRVISIGAAGTFVVRADATAAEIRQGFEAELSVETRLMICRARDLSALVEADPFDGRELEKTARPFISVVERRPRTLPALPLRVPEGRDWQVEVASVRGNFVATLMRRLARRLLYPNEVVERHLGVAATTRGWPTILKVHRALAAE